MLFNSLVFVPFLGLALTTYWLLARAPLRIQNAFLLVSSYVFYGWWDYRFLGLIVLSSFTDYWVGRGISSAETTARRKALLSLSVAVNLGLLGYFKYAGFFISSFQSLLASVGLPANSRSLEIILPVGISFYTFQTLSYTIDIYRRKMEPTRDVVAFFAFVAFFPQLVAGPIERARHLLPQFTRKRVFDEPAASDGVRQMLWGFFKKLVVADNVGPYADAIFVDYATLDGPTLLLGSFFFALQIYCDFSGYSDIAIGLARLFGFSLSRNFAFPYFARDIAEFWRRWHITLSSWFRDYVYIPLGGSRGGPAMQARNVILTFAVSGLWHGANWTFVIWGVLNGLYYLPLLLRERQQRFKDPDDVIGLRPTFRQAGQIGATFLLTLIAWVFFRAESVSHAMGYLYQAVSAPIGSGDYGSYALPLALSLALLIVEWLQKGREHALEIRAMSPARRRAIYAAVGLAIVTFGNFESRTFIYFQF